MSCEMHSFEFTQISAFIFTSEEFVESVHVIAIFFFLKAHNPKMSNIDAFFCKMVNVHVTAIVIY